MVRVSEIGYIWIKHHSVYQLTEWYGEKRLHGWLWRLNNLIFYRRIIILDGWQIFFYKVSALRKSVWLLVTGGRQTGFNSMYLAPAHSFLPFMAKETEILVTLDESLVAPRPDCNLESNFWVDMIIVSIGPLDQLILPNCWTCVAVENTTSVKFWNLKRVIESNLLAVQHLHVSLTKPRTGPVSSTVQSRFLKTFLNERKYIAL